MKTFTVLINDLYPGTPNPLIYVVNVDDPSNLIDVLMAVRDQRADDTGIAAAELDLELILAFHGDVQIAADWRN